MKIKFWVKTSRMLDREETVEIPDGLVDSEIKDLLEAWCRRQFDFDYSDSRICYGWK